MAELLLYYWTGILQLSITVLEVRNLFHHDSLFPTHCEVLDAAESSSMSIDMDRPSQIALRIYQTVFYLSSSLEGCAISYVPLELAEKYFKDLLTAARQSDWGNGNDRVQYFEIAQIGLKSCKLGFEKLRSALENHR
jgi:hypothetical protein